jgi:hypothetical protein
MKKIITFVSAVTILFLASACSTDPVECGEGTFASNGICEAIKTCSANETYDDETNTCSVNEDDQQEEEETTGIQLTSSAVTRFNVGDVMPDFSTYFELTGVTITNTMISHTLLLDATNVMTTPGVYSVTVQVGNQSKTIQITVVDSTLNYDDIVTSGQPGIYVDESKQTEFEIGSYMPNFMTYFIPYDGTDMITTTPDTVLHNLLLNAENRMIQAGTYQVWMELIINGTNYRKEISITVLPVGGSTIESIGDTGWEIVNPEFTDADVFDAWMIPSGDVSVTNTNGEVGININMIGMNFWDILFAQPGKTFEKGYTYEVTFRMKTGLAGGRDVVVFAEYAQNTPKILEEQISLTNDYQDFTFTFQTTSNTTTGLIGVFLGGNVPGAHPGEVMIDSITMTRSGEKQAEIMFEDLLNQTFTDADISMWDTEGNVTLSHDTDGYLNADVTQFVGAFYQDNLQLGGFYVTAGVTYEVTFTVRTAFVEGRDVTFFVENTDAGYSKYFEETETLTDTFQTFTYMFTPTADNDDTKIGIFLGNMDNAMLGMIVIDSITVTIKE